MQIIKVSKVFCFLFLINFIFSGCSENGQNRENLPFIGKHDVVSEKTGDYNIGDTIFHKVPSFEYINQDSVIVKSDDISNKVWVAKFFFASCPTICPPMTVAMKEVHDSIQDIEEDILFLAFSIDPEKDTPSRLWDYIHAHKIESSNWHFLTGVEEEQTHRLGIDGFYIHAAADDAAPGGYAHSSNFVLVDKNQHIRGIYDGLDPDERNRLISDIYTLLVDGK